MGKKMEKEKKEDQTYSISLIIQKDQLFDGWENYWRRIVERINKIYEDTFGNGFISFRISIAAPRDKLTWDTKVSENLGLLICNPLDPQFRKYFGSAYHQSNNIIFLKYREYPEDTAVELLLHELGHWLGINPEEYLQNYAEGEKVQKRSQWDDDCMGLIVAHSPKLFYNELHRAIIKRAPPDGGRNWLRNRVVNHYPIKVEIFDVDTKEKIGEKDFKAEWRTKWGLPVAKTIWKWGYETAQFVYFLPDVYYSYLKGKPYHKEGVYIKKR